MPVRHVCRLTAVLHTWRTRTKVNQLRRLFLFSRTGLVSMLIVRPCSAEEDPFQVSGCTAMWVLCCLEIYRACPICNHAWKATTHDDDVSTS
jgi:hypothetical protein